jgi:hydroxymethylbilane synthase
MPSLKLGTRGSPLALTQAQMVKKKLELAGIFCEIVVIKTQGDLDQNTPLSELGGKGVFIKELEVALLDQRIDFAVHSLKDVTSQIQPELELSAFLKTESALDCLVVSEKWPLIHTQNPLEILPQKAKVGTGSLRRKAILNSVRPDLDIVPLRGNVDTRLNRLTLDLDAIILSHAGLIRLQKLTPATHPLPASLSCPAPGQGVIAIEARKNDPTTSSIHKILNDPTQATTTTWELQILESIAFNCRIPLGIHISPKNNKFNARIFLSNPENSQIWQENIEFSENESQKTIKIIENTLKNKLKEWDWIK